MSQVITGTCKIYVFPSLNRCRMLDMILKRGIKPVGAGIGEFNPYLLFMVDEVMPLVKEWEIKMNEK